MRQLVWKQGNHAIPPGSPGFDPRHCKLSGVCCEGGCARPCPGWRFTRLSPIIQHPAGLRRRPEAWPASRSQIVAASVERSDTMCTDTQSRVLLPSEKKKKKTVWQQAGWLLRPLTEMRPGSDPPCLWLSGPHCQSPYGCRHRCNRGAVGCPQRGTRPKPPGPYGRPAGRLHKSEGLVNARDRARAPEKKTRRRLRNLASTPCQC